MANQAVPIVAEDIVKVVFFVAQVDFVGGSSYTADLERIKNVAVADDQPTGHTAPQVPAQ